MFNFGLTILKEKMHDAFGEDFSLGVKRTVYSPKRLSCLVN